MAPAAPSPDPQLIEGDAAYRAVQSRDPRFDGRLFVGVLSTGIYCRPSCPSRTPRPENCRFFPTAAACVGAGFRACRRCRPDALPGSPDWDVDADLAGRALQLLGDGVIDTAGVSGLARRLSVSPRHLHRVMVAQVGAAPAELARTRRSQVARTLIEQTTWSMADIAFAAGFRSVRQFNEVMRDHDGAPPSSLRLGGVPVPPRSPTLTVRLRHTRPLAAAAWLAHVGARAVPGLETAGGTQVRRVVPAPGGPALALLDLHGAQVTAQLNLTSVGDLAGVVGRLRQWGDLDADPVRVDAALAQDPLLAPLVARRPGLRVPGTVDPSELVLRTVLGQQVSVAAARTLTARLVDLLGAPTPWGLRSFPVPAQVAGAGVDALRGLGLTSARARTLLLVAELLTRVQVGPGADRVRAALAEVPGVGPWTVEYVALRASGDPDAFPAHDLILRRALGGISPAAALRRADRWRPWRGYAAQHLWTAYADLLGSRRAGIPPSTLEEQ